MATFISLVILVLYQYQYRTTITDIQGFCRLGTRVLSVDLR